MTTLIARARELAHRLAGTFRRGRSDADLQEELRIHLEMASGVATPDGERDAPARLAVLRHGALTQTLDAQRDQRSLPWIVDLLHDLSYGWRGLTRNLGFSAFAISSLALGIGANTIVFSLSNFLFLAPLPAIPDPHGLVTLRWGGDIAPDPVQVQFNGATAHVFSPTVFERFRAQSASLADLFAVETVPRLTASIDGDPEVVDSVFLVSGNYFESVKVRGSLGRLIVPADERPEAAPVAVVSYRFWQSRFGADPAAVGKAISLNGVPLTVVGIAPQGFVGTMYRDAMPDFFVPMSLDARLQREADAAWLKSNGNWRLYLTARLRPGTTREQLRAQLEPEFQRTALEGASGQASRFRGAGGQVFSDFETPRLFVDEGGRGLPVDEPTTYAVLVLTSAVALVLLITCVNLACLLLSRANGRRREIAVRLALGAGRGRLVRQLVAESLLLSWLGGVLGIALASWGNRLLLALIGFTPDTAPNVTIDWRVVVFTCAIATLTGILFGVLPAFRSTRHLTDRPLTTMRVRGNEGRSAWAKSLMVTQVALSVVLLVCAGLLVRTLRNLQDVDPGFNQRNLFIFNVDATATGHQGTDAAMVYKRIAEAIARDPGVESATYSDYGVLYGGVNGFGIRVPGFNDGKEEGASRNAVSPDFFKTLQVPVVIGRDFEPRDDRTLHGQEDRAGRVVIVNQAFARKFFGEENPLGRETNMGEVIGVVRDVRDSGLRQIEPTFYMPYQIGWGGKRVTFTVRAFASPSAVATSVRNAVRQVDPKMPVEGLRTKEEAMENIVSQERLFAQLASFLALLATGLVCLGLFGLMTFAVAQRTAEIGIRMALGAQPLRVLRMVLAESLVLVAVGVLIGVGGAVFATQVIASVLYGLTTSDPLTYAAVALLFVTVSAVACLLPARRAARVDPVIALRSE